MFKLTHSPHITLNLSRELNRLLIASKGLTKELLDITNLKLTYIKQ